MAVANINLQQEINDWKSAVYGEEVRGAAVSSLEKIQGTVNDTIQEVNQAAEDIIETASKASEAVADIKAAAEQTINHANDTLSAADEAVEAAQKSSDDALNSAVLSESWAVGGTATRTGEDNNNSKYYSEQAEAQADRAKKYADVTEPEFIIVNNRLYMKKNTSLSFAIFDNRLCWKVA